VVRKAPSVVRIGDTQEQTKVRAGLQTPWRMRAGESPRKRAGAPSLRAMKSKLPASLRGVSSFLCETRLASCALVLATSIGSVTVSATPAEKRLAINRSEQSGPLVACPPFLAVTLAIVHPARHRIRLRCVSLILTKRAKVFFASFVQRGDFRTFPPPKRSANIEGGADSRWCRQQVLGTMPGAKGKAAAAAGSKGSGGAASSSKDDWVQEAEIPAVAMVWMFEYCSREGLDDAAQGVLPAAYSRTLPEK